MLVLGSLISYPLCSICGASCNLTLVRCIYYGFTRIAHRSIFKCSTPFIIPDRVTNRTHFEDDDYIAFQSDGRNRNSFSQSLGVLPSIQLLGERISRPIDPVQAPALPEDSETCSRIHLMNLLRVGKETTHQGERLSLTLGSHLPSHMLIPSLQYRQRSLHSDLIGSSYSFAREEAGETCSPGVECIRESYSFTDNTHPSSSTLQNQSCSTSYETESFADVVRSSRFLKPAQFLLEEVVSVGGSDIDLSPDKYVRWLTRSGRKGALGASTELQAGHCGDGFSSMEKHDFQIRIAKLIALLDEVESRYEQYYNQMEKVVSSFEVIAGSRAAKSYTALALRAMSRHFHSLRDAIVVQINVANRQLPQDIPRISRGLLQLSLFDQETIINRASLQQLGMIRQASRPIRGLPENSVAILRSWLFEHFLNPYPNDPEKSRLASQTGLTKNQVSNWFINARVRLWKPMIEEMYKEEFEESSTDPNPSS